MLLNSLLKQWQCHADKVALIADQQHYTYADLYHLTQKLANNLYAQGIRKKSRVAFFMDNRPELIWLYFAVFELGAIAVPINYRYKADELLHVLNDCQIDMLVIEEKKAPYAIQLKERQALHCKVFMIAESSGDPDWHVFSMLLRPETPAHPVVSIELEDLALILYTSGSTASPKGVMHSHRSVYAAADQVRIAIHQMTTSVNGIMLPICHIAGLIGQVMTTVLVGGRMILFPKFDAGMLAVAIPQYGITHLQMVPASLIELVLYLEQHPQDLSSLKCVMVGGDKVSPLYQEKFLQLSGCPITEVMGMTESFSYCMNTTHDPAKIGSVGKAVEGATVYVIDDHGQRITQPHLCGEVIIQSKANMVGYWGKPQETAATLREGWIYSGDLASQDQEGFFWFAGRKKQLIIRGGSNITPQEVESVVAQHPLIQDVCAIGVPDEKYNQIVGICVVLKTETMTLTLNDLRQFCSDKLSDYKIPEKLFIFKTLPHNATGKLDRNKIAQMLGG